MKFIIVLCAFLALAYCKEEVEILRSSSDIDVDGSFKYGYETSDGSSADVIGDHEGSFQGKFAYTSPEGEKFEVTYVADENGFHPEGAHLPVAPEMPAYITRALEYIKAHPYKEE